MGTFVDVARDLAPAAAGCLDEMEAQGRLPVAMAAEFAAAGLMRMGVPTSIGGPEAHPLEMVDAIEWLARANPSAAWCVMISSTTSLAGGWMMPEAAETVFGDPRGVWAGTVAPSGTITPIDGGVRLDGQWSFGSGCQNATWIGGGAVGADGRHGLCFVPAAEVTIIENWDVVGLRGTGSHDWSATDLDVPDDRVVSIFGTPPVAAGPLYRTGLFGLLAAGIAAVGLGTAAASIDALVDLAGAKTPTFQTRPLAHRSTAQAAVARAATALEAARRHLRATMGDVFDHAAAGGEPTVAHRAAIRRAATHAAETSAGVAEAMFRLAGGTAIRRSAPFARALCDTQSITQHLMVGPATWELTGQELLGLPADRPDL